MTTPQTLELGIQHHRAGRLPEAEAIYRQILAAEPEHADALHLLGVIALQVGRNDVAVDLIRRAIAANPLVGDFYNNLGTAVRNQGQLDDAIHAYRRALQLKPDLPEAHSNLGNALREKGQLDEAIAACRRAVELKPDHVMAHINLGVALTERGHFDNAVNAYRRLLQLHPDNAAAHSNLGNVFTYQGKLDEAIASYRRAIDIKPDLVEAHSNLGNALRGTGCFDEAVAACRRALQFKPDHAEAHNNLGNALRDRGEMSEAIASYRRAVQSNPNFADAHSNLGNALRETGQIEPAAAAYRATLRIRPGDAKAHSYLLFCLQYQPDSDPQATFEAHREWDRIHAQPLAKSIAPHANDRNPERCLRIGYVSGDLKGHSVATFFENLLACHDPEHAEVFCYADVARPDSITARLQQHARHWRNVAGMSDSQIAGMIRQDQIDILVDLAGHTPDNRLLVFARKPAPIQVTYLGYADTTGMSAMDYRLTDAHADPPGTTERFHSEQLVRLPDVFACFRPSEDAPPVSPSPATARGPITFASFHTLAKINERLLECWARILLAVPASRLLLVASAFSDPAQRQRFSDFFASKGVEPGRLDFNALQPMPRYLKMHGEVDVLLDTHPYNAHTISCHALWMGVPVVTLAGDRHRSRMVASVLTSLGLPELIAQTPDEYMKIASELAGDLPRLAELRSTLRERMQASPLLDAPRFARSVEQAYRDMWRTWCANPP